MSYIALVTRRFDEVTRFYGELLGFPIVEEWDRSNARGRRFDTGGMRLEIIDNEREQRPLELGEPGEKLHIVIEVDDIDEARKRIKVEVPPTQDTSWGARLFPIRDPDGVRVTFLQWTKAEGEES
jgi:catechol 2,3-dioxygenase-like lactoylglutathione lyase family enzyme